MFVRLHSTLFNFTSTMLFVKDDKTEENTFEILQHSDRNVNSIKYVDVKCMRCIKYEFS